MKLAFYKIALGLLCSVAVHVSSPVHASDTKAESAPGSTCISCHESLGGDYAKPVVQWRQSIHARMGNNCEGCHGGDSTDEARAMDPEAGFLGAPRPEQEVDFCGRCHGAVKENFIKSRHYLAGKEGKAAPTCTTCHQSHEVAAASLDLINESLCGSCHTYEKPEKLKAALVGARKVLTDEEHFMHYLERNGMDVKQQKDTLFRLHNALHQMTHTLDLDQVTTRSQEVMADVQKIGEKGAALREQVRMRRRVGAGVAIFFLLTAIILAFFKKTVEG